MVVCDGVVVDVVVVVVVVVVGGVVCVVCGVGSGLVLFAVLWYRLSQMSGWH